MTETDMSLILSDSLLDAVATRAAGYDYRVWGYGEGPALLGMLRAGELLKKPSFIDTVSSLVAPAFRSETDPTDHLIPVEVLLELRRLRPGLPVEGLIDRFCQAVIGAARPRRGQPPVHRPDLGNLSNTIWVDCLHTDAPGLTLAGFAGESASLTEEISAVLQGDVGLFSHGYDIATEQANHVHWGRGQGWALHGLVLGAESAKLHARLIALLKAMDTFERAGRWHTIVDDPSSPVENSVSALVASGILLGVARNRLPERWLPLAERALAAAVASLDHDGGLPVSEATPVGDPTNYINRQSGIFPWGQGPLLLALIERRKY